MDILSKDSVPNVCNLKQESDYSSSDGSDVKGKLYDDNGEERTTVGNEGYTEEERSHEKR